MNIEIVFFLFIDKCLHLLCWKPPDHQDVIFNYNYTEEFNKVCFFTIIIIIIIIITFKR